MRLVHRHITEGLRTAMRDSPVVFLQGARQTGKSTLVRSLAEARYVTLDDPGMLAAAVTDPLGFLKGLGRPVIIDEVQRAPGLAPAIKLLVDRDRKPGSFLLTGSANFLVLPKLAESLAGRIEIHTLWPFSSSESEVFLRTPEAPFIDAVFSPRRKLSPFLNETPGHIAIRMARGGFPEVMDRNNADRRRAWFESYLATILQRDVRDIAAVRDLTDMPRILALVAARASGLLDYADISRDLEIKQTTLKRYMAILEAMFLIFTTPAWSVNIGKRLVKAPKIFVADTGLLAHLVGANAGRMRNEAALRGPMLENFAVLELKKQRGWSQVRPNIYHFRTHNGEEVDVVLEDAAGRVVGIEVKGTASPSGADFKGLRLLAEAAGTKFVQGILLYSGSEAIPFGKGLTALPYSALWNQQ